MYLSIQKHTFSFLAIYRILHLDFIKYIILYCQGSHLFRNWKKFPSPLKKKWFHNLFNKYFVFWSAVKQNSFSLAAVWCAALLLSWESVTVEMWRCSHPARARRDCSTSHWTTSILRITPVHLHDELIRGVELNVTHGNYAAPDAHFRKSQKHQNKSIETNSWA